MVHSFTEAEDENIASYVMELHQRSPNGNSIIMHYMLDWFKLPPSFDMTLWLSQILQGMSIKHAVEHWRRTMPRGMGTLYWQLNDCWPVASWASLDHNGRWKALNYMARHFFAPVVLSAVADWDTGSVELHVTSDKLTELAGVVRWKVTTTAGEVVASGEETAVIRPNQNTPITKLDLQDVVEEYGKRNLLVWMTLEVDGEVVSRNFAIFCRPKHLMLSRPEIAWEVVDEGNGRFQVTVSTDKPALWVWLEVEKAHIQASDNFFHLHPNQPHTVTFSIKEGTPGDVAQAVKVRSLYDTYQS